PQLPDRDHPRQHRRWRPDHDLPADPCRPLLCEALDGYRGALLVDGTDGAREPDADIGAGRRRPHRQRGRHRRHATQPRRPRTVFGAVHLGGLMPSIESLMSSSRTYMRDHKRFFQSTVSRQDGSRTFQLPHPNVSPAGLYVTAVGGTSVYEGRPNAVATDTVFGYQLDERNGLLRISM